MNLTAFPHAIIPNKLLQELRELAKTAGLSIALLDELAADIFMGKFTRKFSDVARIASEQLEGSLYARYYDMDTKYLLGVGFESGRIENRFGELCAKRAGVTLGGWSPVANGCVIEQQQILTTQNLASLFSIDDVRLEIEPHLRMMAETTFRWLTSELATQRPDHHSRLIAIKNAAYAWRQMLFYLSKLHENEVNSFLLWADGLLSATTPPFAERFRPAMIGLRNAVRSQKVSGAGQHLLGWTTSGHWLLESN